MRRSITLTLAVLLVAPVVPASGQVAALVRKVFGSPASQFFGAAVAAIGDVDHDGITDFVVGLPEADTGGTNTGSAKVYSGRTGVALATVNGPTAGGELGQSVCSVGDFNDDGQLDFAAGWFDPTTNQGGVRVYTGATGALIRTVSGTHGFGEAICPMGDLNGDGRDDLAVGSQYASTAFGIGAGKVDLIGWAVLGVNVLTTVLGPDAGGRFGAAVASLEDDRDGDGLPELVVGEPLYTNGSGNQVGRVRLVSLGSGAILQTRTGTNGADFNLGIAVAGGGDFNGDGVRDYAAAAGTGSSRVFSGVSGAQIGTFVSGVRKLDFLKDVTGDGKDEIVLGRPGTDIVGVDDGDVLVYSGGIGGLLCQLAGREAGDQFGNAIACADLTGDGVEDFLAGATLEDGLGAFGASDLGSVGIWSCAGPAASHAFGASFSVAHVARAGDVDGDGVGDYLVGSPHLVQTTQISDHVTLYSGATRLPLRAISQFSLNGAFGWAMDGLGDVDGDGYGDFIVGDPGFLGQSDEGGKAEVFSGATGNIIPALSKTGTGNRRLGYAVAGLGDVNGDGVPDYATGAPGYDALTVIGGILQFKTDAGRIDVYSGANGALLWSAIGANGGDAFGTALAAVPDLNGDGFKDLIVGIPGHDGGGTDAGRIEVRSGATGGILIGYDGSGGEALGTSVAAAGDVNGDGVADVAAGGPFFSALFTPIDSGRLRVISGANGLSLLAVVGQAGGEELGTSVAGVGDVDGDGKDDVAAGAPGAAFGNTQDTGLVRIYSGATGAVLRTYLSPSPADRFGSSIAGPGDLDGDCRGDLVVGMDNTGPGITAAIATVLLYGNTLGIESYGQGTAGCDGPICLGATLPPVVGSTAFAITCENGPSSGAGILLSAGEAARLNAGVDPFGIGLLLHLDVVGQPLLGTVNLATNAAGYMNLPSPIPAIPSLAGFKIELQTLWYFGTCASAFGYASSNGLEIRILP